MNMRTSMKAYKKVSLHSQIETASPHKIVQMLLAGAIERLIQGKALMEQKNVEGKCERLGKALEIVMHLRASLSMEDGGEIAVNLDNLYEFIERHITLANIEDDPKKVTEAINLLSEIKEGWDQIPAEFHNLTLEK